MEKNNLVIDSSVLIAFYHDDEDDHSLAVDILEKSREHNIILYPYVIQEVVTILTYRFGLDMAMKFLSDLPRAENVFMPAVDLVGDIEYFQKLNKKISFTDSSLVRLAKGLNAELVTFDRQMMSLVKKV